MDKLYLIMVFGFLLAWEKEGNVRLLTRENNLSNIFYQVVHLVWQSCLLVFLCKYLFSKFFGAEQVQAGLILILFPLTYLCSKVERRSICYFLCLFSLAYFSIIHPDQSSSNVYGRLLFWIFGLFFYQLLILGVSEKLLLAKLNEKIAGLPLFLVVASFVGFGYFGLLILVF